MIYSWVLDSGGAGRGAWQGGVIYEFMRWCRENGCFPSITMGASAGGYAAADVATGTEQTVMKGWTHWGTQTARKQKGFRAHLQNSIHYVMEEKELSGVFRESSEKKLLVFTTRIRRRDLKKFRAADRFRFFLHSATRKLPRSLKYLPAGYFQDPVIFALNLPAELHSGYIRPLTRENYHAAIEASCLVPVAMGSPLLPKDLDMETFPADHHAVFMDGSYTLKMPMRIMEEDPRFRNLSEWIAADKTIIFCCDPEGWLWETTSRLQLLNTLPGVSKAVDENRLLIIYPDHKIEAGFLCLDNDKIMRTFNRGREQGKQLLGTERVRRFFDN
jgi:hypothetical protein